MKRCPSCNRTYTDTSLNYCLEDGTPLVANVVPAYDPHATVRDQTPRHTAEPPATEIYRQKPLLNQVPEMVQTRPAPPQWSPTPPPQLPLPSQKKSNAVWWVVGGIAVAGILGVGLVIMLLVLARMGADNNTNRGTVNSNRTTNTNRTANANANANANTSNVPASFTDNFSEAKWKTGNFQFGDIWYKDDEYHMRSKEKTYLVMYAPLTDYSTENATVRITTRSVDGNGPTSGYGLIVHGQKTPTNQLQDYALLIFTGAEPQYQVVMHKDGNQRTLVPWTKSPVIRSGTSPNQLEVRTRGDQLMFYINGRYLTRVTDTENLERGVAGLYTSEASEVAFDDLEIKR